MQNKITKKMTKLLKYELNSKILKENTIKKREFDDDLLRYGDFESMTHARGVLGINKPEIDVTVKDIYSSYEGILENDEMSNFAFNSMLLNVSNIENAFHSLLKNKLKNYDNLSSKEMDFLDEMHQKGYKIYKNPKDPQILNQQEMKKEENMKGEEIKEQNITEDNLNINNKEEVKTLNNKFYITMFVTTGSLFLIFLL